MAAFSPILMADIKSSGNKNGLVLISDFKHLVHAINKKHHALLLSPLTITLGDEFQGIATSVENAIKLIFEIEELIVKENYDFKLRYVMNLGKIDTKINRKIAYEMLGEGLTEARKELNDLKKHDSRFFIKLNKSPEDQINKAFVVFQSYIDDWKTKDRKAVTEFLRLNDYKKVALAIKTDASSAWRRKKSLKIREYLYIKEIILFLLKF